MACLSTIEVDHHLSPCRADGVYQELISFGVTTSSSSFPILTESLAALPCTTLLKYWPSGDVESSGPIPRAVPRHRRVGERGLLRIDQPASGRTGANIGALQLGAYEPTVHMRRHELQIETIFHATYRSVRPVASCHRPLRRAPRSSVQLAQWYQDRVVLPFHHHD